MFKLLTIISVFYLAAVYGDFPVGITRCESGDSVCLTKSIQEVLRNYPNGLRELNLLPFDPLHIKSLVLERNPSSPVNLEFKFKDLHLIGLKAAEVKQVKTFNFKERNVIEATVPEIILKGNYSVDGRVLILPITGKGKSVITCKNIYLNLSFDLKTVEKNGKTFAQLEHVKLDCKPELVQFQLHDLFNGDKTLGDNMNKFLNENWSDIYAELKDGLAEALGLVAKQMFNTVLRKFPYDILFSKEV